MNKSPQIPISFGTAKFEVFVPDVFSKERQFGVPSFLIEHIRDNGKDLVIYDKVKDEVMLLNVFELFVDAVEESQPYHCYQKGSYTFHYHIFIPNTSDEIVSLLNVTERTLLKRFHWTWYNALKDTIDNGEFRNITKYVQEERKKGIEIYPNKENVFNCFQLDMNNIRGIILAQDPYSNDTAIGYALATKSYRSKSLLKIEKSLQEQFETKHLLKTDLSDWIKQGILLLNSALTVRKGESGSHSDLWKPFIRRIIERVNLLDKSIFIIAMGGKAQSFGNKILDKHCLINVEHPSRATHEERDWIHDNCFIEANLFLTKINSKEIKWIN